jgi:hypothetical protein
VGECRPPRTGGERGLPFRERRDRRVPGSVLGEL